MPVTRELHAKPARGAETTIHFVWFLMNHPEFQAARTHVRWVESLVEAPPTGRPVAPGSGR